MDIPRQKPRNTARILYFGIPGVLALALLTAALGRMKPAAPSVERAGVWLDTVKRGTMLRQVKGPGTLVSESVRWITADTAGRVERIELRPGARVTRDTVLLELSNPDVMLQALESERQLAAAEAELIDLRSRLEQQRLQQEATLASLRTEHANAQRRVEANQALLDKSLVPALEALGEQERAAELSSRVRLEQQRLHVTGETIRQQLAAQRAQIEKLRAVASFRRDQVTSLHVRSGGDGLLSELPLELGQWVTPGVLLAKVVQSDRLKAQLRIAEAQAKDVAPGQSAEIDTRNGVVAGSVTRVAPSASQGTVLVEVALGDELPRGARPDLSVEGTILIEKLEDVLYVGRPSGAQPGGLMRLFKLEEGDVALAVEVQLGRTSVNTIEVRGGLSEGDQVVLSDMSAWDTAERVELR